MRYKTLSIIIPLYNEEHTVARLFAKVVSAPCGKLKKEIIIVDDGSTDRSLHNVKKEISRMKATLKRTKCAIKIFRHLHNRGKGFTVKKGFIKSTGDIVLVQDSDLEYDPSDYLILLEPFLQYGADVVFGSRFVTDRPRRILYFWHYVANIALTTFSNMMTNLNLTDMETGYKAFKGEVIRHIAPQLQSDRFGFEPEIVARISRIKKLSIYEVGISYKGRTYDEGKKIGFIDAIKACVEIVRFKLFH